MADYLAEQGGLPADYFPYQQQQRPTTDFQRYIALLSALNGVGFTFPPCQGDCKTRAITYKDTIFVTGGRVPNPGMNTDEPLLIPGATATLIGWTNQSLTDRGDINGWQPYGHADSFIQIPLSIDYSQARELPDNSIEAQVIDIQSYSAEQRLSGIYTMNDGYLTFEMLVPNTIQHATNGWTITVPDLWIHPSGPTPTFLTTHIQTQVYNWQQHNWEVIPLKTDDTLTTPNTKNYTGPEGQVLVQVSNNDAVQGTVYFSTPSLSMRAS